MSDVSPVAPLPVCPFCYSPAMEERGEYRWACGAWAKAELFAKHGPASVVAYDSACDYIEALRAAKSMIEQNHPRKVDYKGMLVGGGGHGKIEDTYRKIVEVLP